MVAGPATFSSWNVAPVPLFEIEATSQIAGMNVAAARRVDADILPDVSQTDVATAGRDIDRAVESVDIQIARSGARFHADTLWHRNIEVRGDTTDAGAWRLVRSDEQLVALPLNVNGRMSLRPVGVAVIEGAHRFVAGDPDFGGIVAFEGQIAAKIIEHDSRDALGRFADIHVVIVIRAEETDSVGVETSEAKIVIPIRHGEENTDHDDPEEPRSPERPRGSHALAGANQDFDQTDHADPDQQERPVVADSREVQQIGPDVGNQKEKADEDQNQRPGDRPRSHGRAPGSRPTFIPTAAEERGSGWGADARGGIVPCPVPSLAAAHKAEQTSDDEQDGPALAKVKFSETVEGEEKRRG